MKIFIIGLPRSGCSTVAKALVEGQNYQYAEATSWVRSSFRAINKDEHPDQYEDEYQQYLTDKLNDNPWFIEDHLYEAMIKGRFNHEPFVIDGLLSPRDFSSMFDYRKDMVVFLNRTDNDGEFRDHENIGLSVIRDYCFWMSSIGVLDKNQWLEYNFRIPGEESDYIKTMGSRNSVFIIKSITSVITHLVDRIKEFTVE